MHYLSQLERAHCWNQQVHSLIYGNLILLLSINRMLLMKTFFPIVYALMLELSQCLPYLFMNESDAVDITNFAKYTNKTGFQMADQNLNQQVELIFARYDKDNSNTIEISELREYFKDIGMRLSFKELGDVIKCIDINGDGRANRQEIYLGLSQAFGSIASKQAAHAAQQPYASTHLSSHVEQQFGGNVYFTSPGAPGPYNQPYGYKPY